MKTALNNKQHLLAHVQACSPCTYKSILSWARGQGLMAGFTQNINALKHEGKIFMNENDESELIVELA